MLLSETQRCCLTCSADPRLAFFFQIWLFIFYYHGHCSLFPNPFWWIYKCAFPLTLLLSKLYSPSLLLNLPLCIVKPWRYFQPIKILIVSFKDYSSLYLVSLVLFLPFFYADIFLFFFFFYKTWIFQSGALSSLSRKFPFPVPEELGGTKWGNKIEMQQSFLAPSDSVFFHKMISLIGVKGCFFLRIWDIRPRQVTTRCIPFTAGVTEQLEFLSCHSLRADELVIKNGSEPSDLPTVPPC